MEAEVPPLGLWGPGVELSVSGHAVEEVAREPRRARGERGTALVEVTWLGILLLVPLL